MTKTRARLLACARWFAAIGFWIYFKSRWIQRWSQFYRFLYERKYKDVKVDVGDTYVKLVTFSQKLKWTADGIKQLFDVFHSPGYIQTRGDASLDGGDCGSFAIWLATSLGLALKAGTFEQKNVCGAEVISVIWMETTGKMNAHNLCLIRYRIEANDGLNYRVMDYWYPMPPCSTTPFCSLDDAATWVVNRMGPGGWVIGWAVTEPDSLKPLQVHVNFG